MSTREDMQFNQAIFGVRNKSPRRNAAHNSKVATEIATAVLFNSYFSGAVNHRLNAFYWDYRKGDILINCAVIYCCV